jgi:hypothetical protein
MGMNYLDGRGEKWRAEESKTVNRKFLDKRIEWYSRFYGGKTIKVWLSDHGDGAINDDVKKRKRTLRDGFQEDRTHVILGVSGPEVRKIRENRYFQFDGFMLLIKYLLEKNETDYEKMFKPYIEYENYPSYSEWMVNLKLKQITVEGMEKNKSTWQQFLGIRDDKYLYMLYYDGSESFYVLPDEKTDELENPAYTKPLAKFRSLVDGKKFINIFEEDKFVHSRKLYEKIGVHKHIWQ